MRKIITLLGIYLILVCTAGTVQGQGEWVSLEKTTGSGLYQEKCAMCHREGGMGFGILARRMAPELASLENREDLQGVYIETVVRNGLGIMFPMSRGEVSDVQLDSIAAYLAEEE